MMDQNSALIFKDAFMYNVSSDYHNNDVDRHCNPHLQVRKLKVSEAKLLQSLIF